MRLRRHTEIKRRTVTSQGRVILSPEEGAPSDAVRRVTLTLPEAPPVALALGPQGLTDPGDLPGIDDAGATPQDVAEGRAFQWSQPDGGIPLVFCIRADQWVAALATEGLAKVTVIVEYLEVRP